MARSATTPLQKNRAGCEGQVVVHNFSHISEKVTICTAALKPTSLTRFAGGGRSARSPLLKPAGPG